MIGFELTQEQLDLKNVVHEFSRDVIRPAAPDYDESEETPWPIMQQAHELGLDTYAYPEEFGGGGVSVASMCIQAESVRLTALMLFQSQLGPLRNMTSKLP